MLRQHGTERRGTCALPRREHGPGTFTCAGCGAPLFKSRPQVRERHRLAELLLSRSRGGRDDDRSQLRDDAHRGPLRALRRPSRPRVRGRPAADRPSLLHQRRRADVRARAGRAWLIERFGGGLGALHRLVSSAAGDPRVARPAAQPTAEPVYGHLLQWLCCLRLFLFQLRLVYARSGRKGAPLPARAAAARRHRGDRLVLI